MNMVYVGIGGAVGAIFRYAISLIPVKTEFPILTFLTNIIGAFIIGMIVAYAMRYNVPEGVVLLLKTGVCGGFTTFSTFSLESYNLMKNGKTGMACLYAALSLIFCIGAVAVGQMCIKE